ncbi:MAG: tandem-95 repeat protein, partial [Deltaproteobacteria bacterium]|nr:tandem-95 repeat protein [Deltaproteobacteria bacterium]
GSRVRALVLAPNGTLRARSNAQLTGAFFARELVIGQGSLVTFEDGFVRNLPPVADAGGPYSANEGQAVALDATGSRDPDGDLLTYEWDLDADGSFDDASGSTLHVFPNDGAYSIRVRVTDPSGETATASGLVSITNLPPVAVADALRVPEDSGLVTLDPLANDLDWDSLSIFGFTQPTAGIVLLSGAVLEISIPNDFFGTLAFDVTVTDGVALSTGSVALEVDPIPDAPVTRNHALRMREDSVLTLAAPGLLEGAFDADGDPLVARLVSVTPGVTSAAVDLDGALRLRPLHDFEGTIQVVYSADDGLLSSQAVASVFVEDENDAPRFVSTPPTSTAVGELYTYEVGTFDPDRNDSTTLSIDEGPAGMELDAQLVAFAPSEPGDFGVVVRAADTHGAFALQSYSLHVFQPNRPPQIVSMPGRVAAAGEEYEYLVAISDPDTDETFELALESGPSGMVLEGRRLSFTPARSQLGPHLVTIRVADRSGAEARQSFVLEVFDVPVLVAPPIDLTVATSVYEANKFLIEGPAPVQAGVAPGAIDPRRAVWLRGRALLPDGSAAPGAQVSVVGAPELGSTRTRLDGFYDLLVNGGSWVTVRVERGGSFPVDRAIDTVWQETYSFPEVVLSSPRPGTGLDLTLPGAKVALGQVVEDERGARRAAVLFPPGVAAYSGGVPIDELTVSITELSAGSAGPSALTAPLPPTTGYGFVAELIAAESTELVFSSPVSVYLENFLNIPAGKSVPSGSYDRGSARWVAGHDGRAITLLGVDAPGRAELDTDGDGTSDEGGTLGVSDEERALLATLYPAPASLLRVPLRHLSTWAFGYGFAPHLDIDGDNVPNDRDDCPNNWNRNQRDTDKDGIGDACDCFPTHEHGGYLKVH